jgi:hypothetical protein
MSSLVGVLSRVSRPIEEGYSRRKISEMNKNAKMRRTIFRRIRIPYAIASPEERETQVFATFRLAWVEQVLAYCAFL